ncbi:MAG: threonylcarbamoyl-AMP synthase [Candidatus Altiarchaeales archaeon]|nr:threonylcarbamoyl-AMP synthase [Candidatus Altiarchaeales archaeon]
MISKTNVIRVDAGDIESVKLKPAAEALRCGGLVAFPTETVYGLGANALDPHAVKRIFEVKGRMSDNPLIAHIADKEGASDLVEAVSDKASELMDVFWPGPLTLVLRKSPSVPGVLTGGLDSVAVRMPSNLIALSLIRLAGVPVAAPSANLSSKPSPTCAAHVLEDLSGGIDYLVDGGPTSIGVESTVLDLTADPPALLRPGGVTAEEIRGVVGEVEVNPKASSVKSPGLKYRHYSPQARVVLADPQNIQGEADKYMAKSLRVGVMTTTDRDIEAHVIHRVGGNLDEVARNLYATLRRFDEDGVNVIIAEKVGEKGLGHAIMNRLKKASQQK